MSSSNRREANRRKRKYRKPTLRSGRIFERSALHCNKINAEIQPECGDIFAKNS